MLARQLLFLPLGLAAPHLASLDLFVCGQNAPFAGVGTIVTPFALLKLGFCLVVAVCVPT
jgi:hypothetical protein